METILPGTRRGGLSVSVSGNARTQYLLSNPFPSWPEVQVLGLHPSEMFFRQLKNAEFDVSEMSLASLIIAITNGDRRFVPLPFFTERKMFHTQVMVRKDSGIHTPGDLRGKRIGVPEYQQTSAVWARGILKDQFGVAPSDISWFMERPPELSHGGATGFKPPSNVKLQYIHRESSIGEKIVAGELDGTLLYLNEPNLVDRSSVSIAHVCRPLFPDPAKEARRYFASSGVYPTNHTVVVKAESQQAFPGLLQEVHDAFARCQEFTLKAAKSLVTEWTNCGVLPQLPIDTADPSPFGFSTNVKMLEALIGYLFEQGLTSRRLSSRDIFKEYLECIGMRSGDG